MKSPKNAIHWRLFLIHSALCVFAPLLLCVHFSFLRGVLQGCLLAVNGPRIKRKEVALGWRVIGACFIGVLLLGCSPSGEKPKPTAPKAPAQKIEVKGQTHSLSESALLHAAAKAGNTEEVIRLLNQGVPVDIEDSHQGTALFLAAGDGHLEVLRTLLEAGANVNHRGVQGYTALMIGANQGRDKAVEFLAQHGADLMAATTDGVTALHLGSLYPKVIEVLAKAGAPLNLKDKRGYTPIFAAAARGSLEGVKTLLKLGADPAIESNSHQTLLFSAVQWDWLDLVKELVGRGMDVNHRSDEGITVLQLSDGVNDPKMKAFLKSKGATLEGNPR